MSTLSPSGAYAPGMDDVTWVERWERSRLTNDVEESNNTTPHSALAANVSDISTKLMHNKTK
jgi:hypothetical protein